MWQYQRTEIPHTQGRRKKKKKIQELMYRDTMNMEREMYDYSNDSNKRFKEKLVSHTRKAINRFIIKDSYTWNITHNTESTVVWNLKPGQ